MQQREFGTSKNADQRGGLGTPETSGAHSIVAGRHFPVRTAI